MSGATVTIGPSLCNPEALNTVAELREALHRANEQALQMGETLHLSNCVTERVTGELRQLLVHHIERDAVAVHELLSKLVAKYVRALPTTSGAGRVH
jgi:hypothetical protein